MTVSNILPAAGTSIFPGGSFDCVITHSGASEVTMDVNNSVVTDVIWKLTTGFADGYEGSVVTNAGVSTFTDVRKTSGWGGTPLVITVTESAAGVTVESWTYYLKGLENFPPGTNPYYSSSSESGSGTINALNDIGDVDAAAPGDTEVLGFDQASQTWKPQAASTPGAHVLNSHTDVNAPSPNADEVLTWNGVVWVPGPGGGAGGAGGGYPYQVEVSFGAQTEGECTLVKSDNGIPINYSEVAKVGVHQTDNAGFDGTGVWDLESGDKIVIKDASDATKGGVYQLDAQMIAGALTAVTPLSSSGTLSDEDLVTVTPQPVQATVTSITTPIGWGSYAYDDSSTSKAGMVAGQVRFDNAVVGSALNMFVHEENLEGVIISPAQTGIFDMFDGQYLGVYSGSENYFTRVDSGTITTDGTIITIPLFPGGPGGNFSDGDVLVFMPTANRNVKPFAYTAAAPTSAADESNGFVRGSRWISQTTGNEYVCIDQTAGAAVWKITTGSVGSAAWGTLTGTLSDQTDLQGELDSKLSSIPFATSNQQFAKYGASNSTGTPTIGQIFLNGDGTFGNVTQIKIHKEDVAGRVLDEVWFNLAAGDTLLMHWDTSAVASAGFTVTGAASVGDHYVYDVTTRNNSSDTYDTQTLYVHAVATRAAGAGTGDVTAAATLTEDELVVGHLDPKGVKTTGVASTLVTPGEGLSNFGLGVYTHLAGDTLANPVSGEYSTDGATPSLTTTLRFGSSDQQGTTMVGFLRNLIAGDRILFRAPGLLVPEGVNLQFLVGGNAVEDGAYTNVPVSAYSGTNDFRDGLGDWSFHIAKANGDLVNLGPGTHSDLERVAPDAGRIFAAQQTDQFADQSPNMAQETPVPGTARMLLEVGGLKRWAVVSDLPQGMGDLQAANNLSDVVDADAAALNILGTHSDLENAAPDAGAIFASLQTGQIDALTVKGSPVAGDMVLIEDSAAGFAKKKAAWPSAAAEVNDLTASVTWANVPDANITVGSVTQHEAALAIAASQLTGDVAVADGGTGASTAAAARTNLAVPNISTGGTSPVGVVTPGAVGDLYVDTTADIAYQAVGTTSADWDTTTGATGSGILTGTSDPPVNVTDFVAGEFYYVTTSQGLWYNDAGTPEEVGVIADGVTLEVDPTNGLQIKALGVTATQLGAGAVTQAKIAADAVGVTQIDPTGGTPGQAIRLDASGDPVWSDPAQLSNAGAPSASDGNTYAEGTVYIDTTNNIAYTLVDNTTNANVWDGGGSLPSYQDLSVTANISGSAGVPSETSIAALEQEFNHDNLADYFPNQHRAIDIAATRGAAATANLFHYDTALNRLSFDNGTTWTDIALPVDDTTLEVASNQIQVKDAGIVATTKLSATGTKDATTFLRGDNTWAAAGGGSITYYNDEDIGTGTLLSTTFANSAAITGTLEVGTYFVSASCYCVTSAAAQLLEIQLTKGGSAIATTLRKADVPASGDNMTMATQTVLTISVGQEDQDIVLQGKTTSLNSAFMTEAGLTMIKVG